MGVDTHNRKVGMILSRLVEKTADDAIEWKLVEIKNSSTVYKATGNYNNVVIEIEFINNGKEHPDCVVSLQGLWKDDKLYYRYCGQETLDLLDMMKEYARRQRYRYERDVFEQILKETDETDT